MKKGLFIVFDGIDGSGKTENVVKTFNYFLDKSKGYDSILVTREPTNRKYGLEARKLQSEDKDPLSNAEKCLELYVKDRKDHIENIIQPALDQGTVVICDRFNYSTYAYQLVQGIKLETINELHKGLLKPDLTFIFDLPVETAIERIKGSIESKEIGRGQKEKFEDTTFLKESRKIFLNMKSFFPDEKIIFIDATKSRGEVFEEIKKHLDSFLSNRS